MGTLEHLLLVQAASAWFMTGLIWTIQIVHYPLMARVGVEEWVDYEHRHMRRMTWIVAPAMLVEAASCALGLLFVINGIGADGYIGAHITLAVLLLVVWASTWLLQVPAHNTLSRGFDTRAHRSLVRTNWIRTIAWTARSAILAGMLLA